MQHCQLNPTKGFWITVQYLISHKSHSVVCVCMCVCVICNIAFWKHANRAHMPTRYVNLCRAGGWGLVLAKLSFNVPFLPWVIGSLRHTPTGTFNLLKHDAHITKFDIQSIKYCIAGTQLWSIVVSPLMPRHNVAFFF